MLTLRHIATAALVVIACIAAGCNSYGLQGKVVRGAASSVQLVYPDDERLKALAVANAEVRINRDPNTLNRHLVGQARSDGGGEFTIVMSEFGTGWMEEQWLVQSVCPGYQNAEQLMHMPAKNSKWRLLITLAPGVSNPFQDDDPMKDIERFK